MTNCPGQFSPLRKQRNVKKNGVSFVPIVTVRSFRLSSSLIISRLQSHPPLLPVSNVLEQAGQHVVHSIPTRRLHRLEEGALAKRGRVFRTLVRCLSLDCRLQGRPKKIRNLPSCNLRGKEKGRDAPCPGHPPLHEKEGGYLLSHEGSTIGAGGLNFSVRNGKRWDPAAIATTMRGTRDAEAEGREEGAAPTGGG